MVLAVWPMKKVRSLWWRRGPLNKQRHAFDRLFIQSFEVLATTRGSDPDSLYGRASILSPSRKNMQIWRQLTVQLSLRINIAKILIMDTKRVAIIYGYKSIFLNLLIWCAWRSLRFVPTPFNLMIFHSSLWFRSVFGYIRMIRISLEITKLRDYKLGRYYCNKINKSTMRPVNSSVANVNI